MKKDVIGLRFGRLMVLSELSDRDLDGAIRCECRCDCGKTVSIKKGNLLKTYKPTQSCGCLQKDVQRARFKTHGLSRTSTYKSWHAMRQRCLNPEHWAYPKYSRLGICDRWINDFEAFLEDMGPRPKGTTLDRIDNGKGYELSNCRWVGWKKQGRNKTNHFMVEMNGERKCLSEWAELTGIKYATLWKRLKRDGLPPDMALANVDMRKRAECR